MSSFRYLKRFMSLAVALCMLCSFAGCNNASVSSGNSDIKYGDEDYADDEDGDDTVTVNKENKTTKKNNAASYDNSNIRHTFTVDESKKESFLDTVPKDLSGQEVTVLAWWNQFDYETKKFEKFTQKTGIKIKWIYVTGDDYMQRLASLKASGNSPDIAGITVSNFPNAIMQNYFQPVTEGISSFDPDVYDVESMNKFKWNNKYYGIITKGTTYITMALMMYNADLFTKYGVKDPYTLWQENNWNWDTFLSTANEIQRKSSVTALTAEYHGFRLAQTCGEDAVTINNGKITNNTGSKTYRDAYKWINELQQSGQYKVADFSLNRDGFLNGKAAMLVQENWALQKGERFSNTSFSLGYAPLPCPTYSKLRYIY